MITAKNLTKTGAGRTSPVHGIDLEIPAGAIFGLLGRPSAGGSTLLSLLGLTDTPDEGVVSVDGLDTGRLDRRTLLEVRSQFAGVDRNGRLVAERTVAGNIAVPLERLGVAGPTRRERVAQLLDLIGMSKAGASRPADLNRGQYRRVLLARALATNPAVLLVDEPTAGLTADDAAGVLAAIDRARAELDATVIVATSEPGVVGKVCDHVAVLSDGKVQESGAVLGLLADQTTETARRVLPTVDTTGVHLGLYDRVADVVLIGHALVGSLLPETRARFGVEVTTIDGGVTHVGEVPVARFRLGVRGGSAGAALGWIEASGASVTTLERALVAGLPSRRELAGVAA